MLIQWYQRITSSIFTEFSWTTFFCYIQIILETHLFYA